MRYLIKNGIVIHEEGRRREDVLLQGSRIEKVADAIVKQGDMRVIDAAGCYIFPGFIDPHVHFDCEVGNTTTADKYDSGSRAALLGGTTTVLDFAEPSQGETLLSALGRWMKKAEGSSCNYGFHMTLNAWNDRIAREMEAVAAAGVSSYKMFMVYAERVEDGAIYGALKRAKEIGALIGVHCENFSLIEAMTAEEKAKGNWGVTGHSKSRPAGVEAEAVGRYLRICELANAPGYVVHLSTGVGLQEARHARQRGQQVYLETCPQYLVLDENAYLEPDGAKYVLSPPLRPKENNEWLWEGLAGNEIQTVGTDHCSFTMRQKAMGAEDFTKIPNGGAGVQNRAELYYTYGVLEGRVSLEQMAMQLSGNAARIFGMYPQKGVVQEGGDADLVIWDPSYTHIIRQEELAHACDNSLYEGMRAMGRAREVFVNGVWAVRGGKLATEGQGRFLKRGVCAREWNGR